VNSFVKLGVGFVGVVAAATALVLWLTSGEDHEVLAVYSTLISDAREYRPDAVMSVFSMQYRHDGETFATMAKKARRYLTPEQFESIEERGSPKSSVLEDKVAVIEAEYEVVRREMGHRIKVPVRVRLQFEKEPAGVFRPGEEPPSYRWVVTAVDVEQLR
jgi:hypothetical protein